MVKLRIVTCVLILLNMVVCNISYAKQPLNKIAATVGNDIITTSELSNKTNLIINNLSKQNISLPPRKILEHQVLNKIILDKIQLQMAQQLAITVDSTSVNQTIEDLAKQEHSTIAEYKQKIQAEGIKFEDFREHIKTELTISRLQQREISNEIRISNADIDGYLNSPAGQDNSGTEYNLGHILIIAPEQPTPAALKKAEIKATNLVNELKKGKDFKQIAMANSADMRALDGGDLGWRQLNEIPTIFVKHVPNMQINEIIGPIQSASGFHIIKLYNKRSGKKADYSELRVRQILIKPSNSTSEQEAKTILSTLRKQITQGQDFAKLAEKRSEELQTAVKGGDLGWITEASVIPEFWDNIIKLPIGEVSEPFKTELGWHLVQVTERRNADHSKDALRNRATEILRERKFNEMLEIWLKKIRDEAKVDVLL
jgi:peptidyl-prolyl cis-trans isomerase SurA